MFDTSAVGGDTVDSAILSQQLNYVSGGDSNSNQNINVCTSDPASDTAIVAGDYDITSLGSTKLTTDFTITSAMSTSAYRDLTLNASGEAEIDGSGVSKFSIRFSRDMDNSDPSTNKIRVKGLYAETSGTTGDPKLVVEHSSCLLYTSDAADE